MLDVMNNEKSKMKSSS